MTITLKVRNLLEFYDDPAPEYRGQHTAITSVVGEDMAAGLLLHYWQSQGIHAEVLPGSVTQGTQRGHRLDRWIKTTERGEIFHYQVEIKNWAANAIGGRKLAVNALASEVREHKLERWSKEWDGNGFIKVGVKKVLVPMKPREGEETVRPLVAFWNAMHPQGEADPLFSMPLRSHAFPRVWVFSMSAYLRDLHRQGMKGIKIYAPAIEARLEILQSLINT